MKGVELVTGNPELLTLGWAGLNFVWQGALLALVLRLLLSVVEPRRAAARHLLGLVTLASMAGLPAASLWKGHLPGPPVVSVDSSGIPVVSEPDQTLTQSRNAMTPPVSGRRRGTAYAQTERLLPWAATLWIAGAVTLCFRTLGGLVRAQTLIRNAGAAGIEGWVTRAGSSLAGRIVLPGNLRILESDRVSAPAVIGWLKPAILVPEGAVSRLPRETLDALLAHEVAHIHRRDFAVNLLQTAVENLLFYHPAVWWVSSRVRQEREYCCDDVAAAVCGGKLVYARALSRAERFRSESQLAISAGGGRLLNRIRRITEMSTTPSSRTAVLASGLLAFALVVAAGVALSAMAFVPAQAKAPKRARIPILTAADLRPGSPAPGTAGEGAHPYMRTIAGKVADPSGAVIPGAVVRVNETKTGRELLTASTDDKGEFAVELPSTEDIEIRVEHPGFRAAAFRGDVLQSGLLDVVLRVGRISEVVTIKSSHRARQSDSPAREPIRVHGGLVPPKLVHGVEPVYPPEARAQSVEGTVEIVALIDTRGEVKDARVVKGHPLLHAAALKAVRQWRYTPALMNGEPWPVELGMTLVFQLTP
jgi:TonB family protein